MANLSLPSLNRFSPREQRLLKAMTGLLAVCLLYYTVWLPAGHKLHTAQQAYNQQLALLQWVEANESRAQSAGNASAGNDTIPLPELLTNTAQENHLSITRLETSPDRKTTLVLERVPFNALVTTLDGLQRNHHVTLLLASVSKCDVPGHVNATLQLSK